MTLIITLSNIAAGMLADVIGTRGTIAAFAIVGIVASVVYLSATRGIRERLIAGGPSAAVRSS